MTNWDNNPEINDGVHLQDLITNPEYCFERNPDADKYTFQQRMLISKERKLNGSQIKIPKNVGYWGVHRNRQRGGGGISQPARLPFQDTKLTGWRFDAGKFLWGSLILRLFQTYLR